jgi:hypothetical protein
VWLPPALTDFQLAPLPIRVGVLRLPLLPLPTWPWSSLPQQYSRPVLRMAHWWASPTLTDFQSWAPTAG